MARKNLLKGLMDEHAKGSGLETKSAVPPARVDAAKPRYTKGAIGAVSQSIEDLKRRSIVELDPQQIDAGGLEDRLEHDSESHAALVASIRDYGQQVPILVRPHPEDAARFQIVYGRRRVLALRDLGQPIKALVRDLDDRELVVAQGQENSARRDLTFIEKANFARQMDEAGYDRKTTCAALHIDKTVISRMLSVTSKVPIEVIETIGSAPGIGRDRWLALAEAREAYGGDADAALALAVLSAADEGSDARFEAYLGQLKAPTGAERLEAAPKTASILGDMGEPLGKLTQNPAKTTLVFKRKSIAGFDEWLVENMSEIHRNWKNQNGG